MHFGNKINASKDEQLRQFNKDLTEAKSKLTGVENENLQLRGQATILETGLSEAKTVQAKAEKDLLELQQRVQPRSISDKERRTFVAASQSFPKGFVDIICVLGDGEGLAYAQQIAAMLNAAGWTTPTTGVNQGAFSGRLVGLALQVRSAQTAPPYAGALQKAFQSIGLSVPAEAVPTFTANQVELLVGNKP